MAEEKKYKCDMCGATFKSQPELMEHNKKEHKKS
jgi:DNA-directed RNA polymerase subunit RPC12/RpoP